MIVNVVTAVSRPNNLKIISDNLKNVFRESELRWYVIFDNLKVETSDFNECYHREFISGDLSGAPQKNRALELIQEGWVYFLDDDNLMHQDFENVFLEKTKIIRNSFKNGKIGVKGIVFGQTDKGKLRLSPSYSEIDCGQFILDREIIEDARFPLDCYRSDNVFFREVSYKHKEKILLTPELLTYYNELA